MCLGLHTYLKSEFLCLQKNKKTIKKTSKKPSQFVRTSIRISPIETLLQKSSLAVRYLHSSILFSLLKLVLPRPWRKKTTLLYIAQRFSFWREYYFAQQFPPKKDTLAWSRPDLDSPPFMDVCRTMYPGKKWRSRHWRLTVMIYCTYVRASYVWPARSALLWSQVSKYPCPWW